MKSGIEELAGCLIMQKENILLVKETKDRYWKIPSGKVDKYENLEKAAIRETEEETGLEVNNLKHFNTYNFNFKNRNFRIHVYTPEIIKGTPKRQRMDETSEIGWFQLEALNQEDITPSNKLIYQDLIAKK